MDGRFFLTIRKTFETLNELVDYYRKNSDGLCVLLGQPCLRVRHGYYTVQTIFCELTHETSVRKC